MAGRGTASGTPTTYTIYGEAADGYLYTNSWPASSDGSASGVDTTGDIYTGQQVNAVYGGYIAFDTSVIADTATITAATLSLWGMNDSSTTDFTLEARVYDWGATLTTADWRGYLTLGGLTLVASVSTSGWSTSGYNVLTSNANFLTAVNVTGFTRLVMDSSRYVAGTSPGGTEFVGYRSGSHATETNRPRLVVDALV